MMPVVAVLIHILEGLFAAGMAGSALVVILTGFEDVETMFDSGDDESSH